jgi:hypothetical protein
MPCKLFASHLLRGYIGKAQLLRNIFYHPYFFAHRVYQVELHIGKGYGEGYSRETATSAKVQGGSARC